MNWSVLLCGVLLGALAMYVYFMMNPPQCPSCKAKGATDAIWARLREVPEGGNVNVQDDDI
jgi:hypothetical protein